MWTVESETVTQDDITELSGECRDRVIETTMLAPLLVTTVVTSTLLGLVTAQTIPQQMTIAAVFDEGGDRKHELAFRHAVRSINRNKYVISVILPDSISSSFDHCMVTN